MELKTFFIGFICGAVFYALVCAICKRAVSKQSGTVDELERRTTDDARQAERSITEATEQIGELTKSIGQIEQTTNSSKELNTRARELAKQSAELLQETKQLLQDCKVHSSSVATN